MARRTGRRATGWSAAVLLGAAVLAGCSAGSDGSASTGAADAVSSSGSAGSGEIAPAAPERSVVGDGAAAAPPYAAPEEAGAQPVGSVDRSLVRTAQVSIEVADTEAGLGGVRSAAAGAGGFVTQEQSGSYGGSVVVRVPADALDRVIDQVVGLAAPDTEVGRSTTVVDATEEVVDLDARVASQQASVARVRTLLAEATSIGDVVAIESELARREAELDSLTGRLAALRDQVALSTLSVDLRGPDAVAVDPSPAGFTDGLAAGWEGLLAFLRGAGVFVGFLLPFLPVLAVLAGAGWLVVRLLRGRVRPRPDAG